MTDDVTEASGFIEPVPMEDDLAELFPGDRGVLDPEVRRTLALLLHRRFLLADRNRVEWRTLLDHQTVIESRLNDLYIRLIVDHEHGLAYKQQIRIDELDIPILLRDTPYTRSETLVLVHLRTVYERENVAGEAAPRIDIEDVEATVLSYFTDADGDISRRQKAVRDAMRKLANDGIISEETTGRYRIGPLVEVVLSAEKLTELRDWLRETAAARLSGADGAASGTVADDEEAREDVLS
ncbi:DUF4194 domain-containing protein [uncultured Microbacterium sp.]|uniref:DUF4194 domain-containing protein n=1 Tax=uncultured Microbacterium sp. TaxID=191216 RepID=UPI0025FFCAF0|nr:DUF4194 domain-containing protein [uncultured Microbacterium sp.]